MQYYGTTRTSPPTLPSFSSFLPEVAPSANVASTPQASTSSQSNTVLPMDAWRLLIGDTAVHLASDQTKWPEHVVNAHKQIKCLLQLHLCANCKIYKRDVLTHPCNHLTLCQKCASVPMAVCPITSCQSVITRRVRVNFTPYARQTTGSQASQQW